MQHQETQERPSQNDARPPFLGVLRELALAYQAFSATSAGHVRQLGLTPSQFDVIATLGNTPGIPLHELTTRTLITKGTLTGVLDRLELKGLVRRAVAEDRRSYHAVLTPAGEDLFAQVFPAHMSYLAQFFRNLDGPELQAIQQALSTLRHCF
ncbi:MAG: MarR family winged helix-turn-helix transcriptional regulator [Acidiferrobacteraceae bacterium]